MEDQNKLNENQANDSKTQVVKKDSIIKKKMKQWLTNKNVLITLILIITLVVTVFYYKYQLSNLTNEHEAKEQEMKTSYESKIQQITLDKTYLLCKVFTWSVRSELMRANNEQVSLLLNEFIKTSGLARVSLIHPGDRIIALSTDKKVEGTVYENAAALVTIEDAIVGNKLILPILGLSETIGYLEFDFDFKAELK